MFDSASPECNLRVSRSEGDKTRSHQKKLLKMKKTCTERFKKSLSYQGPRKWNRLPVAIQLCPSKTEFKNLGRIPENSNDI